MWIDRLRQLRRYGALVTSNEAGGYVCSCMHTSHAVVGACLPAFLRVYRSVGPTVEAVHAYYLID